ncbi:MAG: hypothetical protein MJY55_04380 [Bacteroidales bacterium]|nr:hypothetical protein [Bacteroidales bacterium]
MKKILILLAGLSLLASCAQNLEPTDKGKEKNPGTGTTTDQELTLNTRANLTKAIAEGTEVPNDNFIGFMPNFQSDIAGVRYDEYNQIATFGYDDSRKLWRGIAVKKESAKSIANMVKSLFTDLQPIAYVTNPFYWPGGDRITMDYVAFSYFNMRDVLYNTAVSRYNLGRVLSQVGPYIDYVLAANPYKVNANRMNVWYQNQILNVLSYAMSIATEDSIVLSPYVLSVVLALGALTDDGITMPGSDQPVYITGRDVTDILDDLVPYLSSGEEIDSEKLLDYLKPLMNRLQMPIEFIQDFAIAYDVLNGDESKIGEGEDQITEARLNEVVNDAYWLFFNNLHKVGKFIQDDLLYAYDRGLKNTTNGRVDATFNHAKAWVKVVVNNMTDNDLFVSGISFDKVRTDGTLVIDNSKSAFEAYWDFDAAEYHPDVEPVEEGAEFEAYDPMTLQPSTSSDRKPWPGKKAIADAEAQKIAEEKKAAEGEKAQEVIEKEKPSGWKGMLEEVGKLITGKKVIGYIPDTYLVPAHCYGPALQITTSSPGEESSQSGEATKAASQSQGHKRVAFTCLNGSMPFEVEVAKNLSGAMFPSQEPGTISLSYYSWESPKPSEPVEQEHAVIVGNESGRNINKVYPMDRLLDYLNQNQSSGHLNTVTLNLPRVKWEMGKVYIYVINIANNEITINSQLVPWDSQIVPEEEEETVPGSTTPVVIEYPGDWWK